MDDKFPIDNEEQFFHNLFVEYYPSLCSFALRYVGDGEVVEDLVQDVFVKLWETRERWRAVADFSAYVLGNVGGLWRIFRLMCIRWCGIAVLIICGENG